MLLEEFPGCCGVLVLHELDACDFLQTIEVNNLNSAYITIKSSPKLALLNFLREEGPMAGILLVATTISDQTLSAEALKEVGFRPVETFRNPNTGNIITVWHMLMPKNIEKLYKAQLALELPAKKATKPRHFKKGY